MASAGDIHRAKNGKAAWNAWATTERQASRATAVDFSGMQGEATDFAGFDFPGPANFRNAVFAEPASFSGATFRGDALFSGAIFHADVSIDRVSFERDVDFRRVQFKKHAYLVHDGFRGFVSFEGAKSENLALSGSDFHSEANFDRAWFNYSEFTGVTFKHSLTRFNGVVFERVPDFRAVTFKAPPLIQGIDVRYAKYSGPKFWRRWALCAAGEDDAAKFRRLKQLASDWRDHERELEFFAKELRANRFHETRGCGAILLNLAYGGPSNFGRSVARPVCWLVLLTLFAAVQTVFQHWPRWEAMTGRIEPALVLSATDAALLLGSDKWGIRGDACDALYGAKCNFSLGVGILAYAQSAVSLFLLFLVGLGLRNRFRTGSA